MAGNKHEDNEAHATKASPRFRSLSGSGLVTGTLKFCCVSRNLLCFGLRLCIRKFYCVLKKIVVLSRCALSLYGGQFTSSTQLLTPNYLLYPPRLLGSRKDCCFSAKIVVFCKRLLCFRREIELCFAPMGHRTQQIPMTKI